MKSKIFITKETNNERLDAIYWLLWAIKKDIKSGHTIEEILAEIFDIKV